MLVVEDEPLIALDISDELTHAGYNVLTAANADEAIVLLEKRSDIATIFTDIDMPGSMNGLKLAAAVRKRWPPVNIIITTGKRPPTAADMPERSLFLAKPYQAVEVVKALEACS